MARCRAPTHRERVLLTVGIAAVVLLGFTWIGYPLVIALLAQLRSRPKPEPGSTIPVVSVILATRATVDAVRARVQNLLAADYPPERLDIVVSADANQRDDLTTIAQMGPRVQVVQAATEPGKPAALNAGVARARGEVLVFADTAQRFDRDAIGHLVRALGEEKTGAVSGQLDLDAGSRWSLVSLYWRLERSLRANEARLFSAIGVTGAIYAMRRSLWEPLPSDTLLDDLHGPMRLVLQGYRVGFEPRAVARDAREFTAVQEHRRKERTLTGVLQLCAAIPGVLNPMKNPAWLQFVCHKLLRFATPFLVLLTLPAIGQIAFGLIRATSGSLRVALAVATLAGPVIVLAVPGLRRRLMEFVWMQIAIVRALGRAARGDWRVW